MNTYDIVFIGHISVDEIRRFGGRTSVETGGAAFYSSMAACVPGLRIAVITRMARDHHYLLDPLKARGIDVYVQPSPGTSHLRVVHRSANLDEREILQTENSGFFEHEEIAFPAKPRLIHLGALTDREFSVEFMTALKARGFDLSVDMQGFVRQVDAESGVIHFRDVPRKKEIIAMARAVKLDVVEAELLTGKADLSHAARIVEEWGSPETMVTRADGVLVRADGQEYFEPFTNRSNEGDGQGRYDVRRLSGKKTGPFNRGIATVRGRCRLDQDGISRPLQGEHRGRPRKDGRMIGQSIIPSHKQAR
jgi:sugar/nucleoside kinase (ribokinase family)